MSRRREKNIRGWRRGGGGAKGGERCVVRARDESVGRRKGCAANGVALGRVGSRWVRRR